MSNENQPENFACTVFLVDGKTVDANGKEVEVKEDKPAKKAPAKGE